MEYICVQSAEGKLMPTTRKRHIKIFRCSCQDPGCSVIVIEDDYTDAIYAEFPVCISISSGWDLSDKLLSADRLYERGNILFRNVAAAVNDEGEPVFEAYRNTREGYIQKLIFGLLSGHNNPATVRLLHANGITAWRKDFYDQQSKRTFIRYRRVRDPLGILRSLYEWLSLPLFALPRLILLLCGKYRVSADCMIDKTALEEYAQEKNFTELMRYLPDEDGNGGSDMKPLCSGKLTLGVKLDSALRGLAIRKIQCCFYGTGECEYRLF